MQIKCEKCGSTRIVQGRLSAVNFVPLQQSGAVKQTSPVLACSCTDCGYVFNLRLENPIRYPEK